MRKIKPLYKKHRFIKWLKKLFGIKPPSIGEWKDIDEMHLFKNDEIYEALKQGMTQRNEDVIAVVRCKDCKRRNTPDCSLWYGAIGDIHYIKATTDDFYCSYGKRRANNEG